MIETGARQIAYAPALRRVAPLPLLLFPAAVDGLVERPHTEQRRAANRHVRTPDEIDVTVVRSVVEGGDRCALPATGAWPALERGPARTAAPLVVGIQGRALQ